ncbi:MAG: hypothetical protein RIC95_01315 [Vicingaceae bacterium]
MKSTFGCIVFLLCSVCTENATAQELKLDSLVSEFDRICDCRNLKSTSEASYASCLEKELENPFFHRTDFLQLSNYWAGKDNQKAFQYAKSYFDFGGYFIGGIDSSLLKKQVKVCVFKEVYFNDFYNQALSNQKNRDSIFQANSHLANALVELKPYDQFMRSNKEENIELMNDSNLEKGAWKIQIRLDSLNRMLLASVLDSNWITIDLYGFEANKVAWLIAQHADEDLHFQENCLKLMLVSYPRDRSASGMYLAYLIDRLSINTKGYQFFGTQFTYQNGALQPKPIQGEEKVNQRRKQVYLPPLENYLKDSKEHLQKK